MKTFNIGLFLLSVGVSAFEPGLRGGDEQDRNLQSHGYHETMGQCRGAVCGLWGDPHMVTCDGLGYDCQSVGLVNVMNNTMWQVQAHYVPVGLVEAGLVRGWGLTEGATLTNGIALEYKYDDSVPVMQFGFGDLSKHDGTFASERGCIVNEYYNPTNGVWGQGRTVEPSIRACRLRCEATEGCSAFNWWADGGCHLNTAGRATRPAPGNWARSVRGTLDSECGTLRDPDELEDVDEREKHGQLGRNGNRPNCPLLYYEDGILKDISTVGKNGFYYGHHGADHLAQNINNHAIRIAHKLPDGSYAEAHLIAKGAGPNEIWSCHFDFYICLPASRQTEFMEGPGPNINQGLLGTPNGNRNDEFSYRDSGEGVSQWEFKKHNQNWHKSLIDYCYGEQCIKQEDSIFTPPSHQTFDDIKCHNMNFTDFSVDMDHCVLTGEEIVSSCAEMPPLMVHACEIDCCEGGCDEMRETEEEVTGLKELSTNPRDILYDEPKLAPPACEDLTFHDTSSTVCPGTDIVKLLKTHGTQEIPDGGEIIYGIKPNSGDDNIDRTVKFRVNNPFPEDSHVYIKYDHSVMDAAFQDPKCDTFLPVKSGCDDQAPELEVSCKEFDGVTPFALVSVYFASESITGTTAIDQCCKPEDYAGMETEYGIVEYTFEIDCTCPETAEGR